MFPARMNDDTLARSFARYKFVTYLSLLANAIRYQNRSRAWSEKLTAWSSTRTIKNKIIKEETKTKTPRHSKSGPTVVQMQKPQKKSNTAQLS